MHGSPEPDAATRAIMNQGLEKGTPMGETIRFVMQFKRFSNKYVEKKLLVENYILMVQMKEVYQCLKVFLVL